MTTTAHFISRTYLFQFWLVLHSETTFKIGDVRNPIVTLSSKDVKYINRLTIVSLVGLKSEMAESLLATYLESSNQVLSMLYLRPPAFHLSSLFPLPSSSDAESYV